MKSEIKIPSMGESITEATIGAILKPSGSAVKADDEILEIETDKVNQVLFSPQKGVLTLTIHKDDVVKIGQVIGFVDDSQSGSEDKEKEKGEPSKDKSAPASQEPAVKDQDQKVKLEDKPVEQKAETSKKPEIEQNTAKARLQKEDFIKELKDEKSSPLKKELPKEASKVDLKPTSKGERETRRPMSKIRTVIASRMVESLQTTAMLTTFNEIDLSEVIRLREKFKDNFFKANQAKLGFMSFFVKAVVFALKKIPDLNSYIDQNEIVHRDYYDIGVAVGTDKGVIVPVLRECDKKTFAEIEQEIEAFARKAREGKIIYDELKGGGFTITNGGIYGSLLSTPILSPAQSGILGMHKIEKRPVVIDDKVVIRPMMYVALSYDHRIVDGKEAVTFLVHIKNSLEDPARLLMDV